jgi:nitroreductase
VIPNAIESLPVSADRLLAQLQWRYATKKFDAQKKIPAEQWAALEEAMRLSPSSFGLQPWKFLVVENPALREQLKAASWGQTQVTDASHLVVFTVKASMGPADVDRLVDAMVTERGADRAQLEGYRQMMLGFVAKVPFGITQQEWSSRQVYIAVGQLLAAAAMLGVDACPIEGLDPAAYDRILGLESKGFHTLCASAVGYRAADDRHAGLAKIRYPLAEIVERV